MTTLSKTIAASADDGNWGTGSGYQNNGGTVTMGGYFGTANCWFRMTSVTIPNGATVSSNTLTVFISTSAGTAELKYNYVDEDSATAPTSGTDADGRTRTTANTTQSKSGGAGASWTTSSFASSAEELFARAGWASGQNVCLFCEDNNSNATHGGFENRLQVRAYDFGSSYPQIDWTYTSAVTAALPVGTVTATGVLPATKHNVALPVGSASVSGVLPTIQKPASLDTGTITATGMEPAAYSPKLLDTGMITATGVLPSTTHFTTLPIGTLTMTERVPTVTHQTSLPVGTITAGVATENEIQELYFNGATMGSYFIEIPSIGLLMIAGPGSDLPTWQSEFDQYGTVSSISGGLRFEFDEGVYANRNIDPFQFTFDSTGVGTTATIRNGSDGNALSVVKSTELLNDFITVSGIPPTAVRFNDLPVGTATITGVEPATVYQASLPVGTVTVTGIVFTTPDVVFVPNYYPIIEGTYNTYIVCYGSDLITKLSGTDNTYNLMHGTKLRVSLQGSDTNYNVLRG